jgi:hypothetical protein
MLEREIRSFSTGAQGQLESPDIPSNTIREDTREDTGTVGKGEVVKQPGNGQGTSQTESDTSRVEIPQEPQ